MTLFRADDTAMRQAVTDTNCTGTDATADDPFLTLLLLLLLLLLCLLPHSDVCDQLHRASAAAACTASTQQTHETSACPPAAILKQRADRVSSSMP